MNPFLKWDSGIVVLKGHLQFFGEDARVRENYPQQYPFHE
jgi:hypothetical protein